MLLCCGKSPSRDTVFVPDPDPKIDSLCIWLEEPEHYNTPGFYAIFENHYAQQLKKKDYVHAAEAITAVADQEMYYFHFDSAFGNKLQAFDTLYADRLPWHKTLFLEEHAGYQFMDRGEFRKAIACFRKATDHEPFDYVTCIDIANLYNDMAFCYAAIGDQEQALRCNNRALAYFSKTGSLTGMGGAYDNIALVHMFTKNYAEAEAYFDKALQAYGDAGDTTNMFTTLHNRIILYEETNDARKYPHIDSTYRFFVGSGLDDASLHVALANFYVESLLHKGKISEAKTVLDTMKVMADELNSSTTDDDYRLALAQYELKTHAGILDKPLMEDALRLAEESEHFQNQLAFCKVLKEDALLHGDYKKALEYSEKEKAALDKLANRDMVVKTMELNKRHETEKKEQYIALQAETIWNNNITIALLLCLLVAFCLVGTVLYVLQQQKKIRTESRQSLLYTRQLLEKTEEERKRIAGDLHDSVSHELLILKNAIHNGNAGTGDRIDAIINDIRTISRNLHPIMFEKVGLEASVEQLVERTQTTYGLMVTADVDYDGSLPTPDELQVYRIIQEALSNTIKYAGAVAAKITLYHRNGMLHIEIKDNGKGFDVAEKMGGTAAFGLHNILERSRAIGGFAKIHSDRNGTVITIEIKTPHENIDS